MQKTSGWHQVSLSFSTLPKTGLNLELANSARLPAASFRDPVSLLGTGVTGVHCLRFLCGC